MKMKNSVASMCPSNEDTSTLVHVFTDLDLLCFTGLFGVFLSIQARTEIAVNSSKNLMNCMYMCYSL